MHFSQDIDSREVVERLKEKHVIVGIGYEDVLRIKPPITIQKGDIASFIELLKNLLTNYHNNGLKRSQSTE